MYLSSAPPLSTPANFDRQVLKQDICLALAALRSPSIPQFDPYQTHPPSSSTISDTFLEYEVTRPPLNSLALFLPSMTVPMELSGSRNISKVDKTQSIPGPSSTKLSSDVITGPITFYDDVKAAVSTHFEISDIAALDVPPEAGHSNVLVDAGTTPGVSSSSPNTSNAHMEPPFHLGTTLLNPSDAMGLISLSKDKGREVPAEMFPVVASPSRRPAVQAWWNAQQPITVATVSAARNASHAFAITPSPLLHSELRTSAGCTWSNFAPPNPCDLSGPFVHDRPPRRESSSSLLSGGQPSHGHSSRSPPLQCIAVNGKCDQARIPQTDDVQFVVDVRTTTVLDSQDVSPRSSADIPSDINDLAGNTLPRLVNLVISPSLPSHRRSSIPSMIHLASSLSYNPSGSSGPSLIALPLRVNGSARQVSILEPSTLAHPAIPASANAQSTATITFNDGKELIHCQTRPLVFELVSANLPKASTIR
ncbi:hypothetical protein FRB97_008965, partial [Tulasnella sp. 331]